MEYVLNVIGLPPVSLKRIFSPVAVLGQHLRDHFIPHTRNNYHPHILGHRNLALMSGLLVVVKLFTFTLLSFGPIAPAFSSAITPDNIITLTNESRQQFSVPALTENQVLDRAAQAKADDMLAKGYFAHNSPDGRTPWDFITTAGYSYLMAGENLAVNFTEAENVETAWMNSPGHKANILNKNFQNIGIGISQGVYQGHTAIFVVQEFGVPAAQQIALTNTQTPVQTAPAPAPATLAAPAQVLAANLSASAQTPVQTKGADLSSQPEKPQAPAAVLPAPVTVQSGDVKLVGNQVEINAQVSGPATKVLAYFGQQAIMLAPKDQTTWSGQTSAGSLAQSNTTVRLVAQGMRGQTSQLQLADFSADTQTNYNLSGTTPVSYASFMGRTFNPNTFETRFCLFFIAGILSSLILAISFKRHIQHLSLIANSSFVVIFAALLLWAG